MFPKRKLIKSVWLGVNVEWIKIPNPMVTEKKMPIMESEGRARLKVARARIMVKIRVTNKVERKKPKVLDRSKMRAAIERPKRVEWEMAEPIKA